MGILFRISLGKDDHDDSILIANSFEISYCRRSNRDVEYLRYCADADCAEHATNRLSEHRHR